jgi:hypothetical protein
MKTIGIVNNEKLLDLLTAMKSQPARAAIKFRQLGDTWCHDFLKVAEVSTHSVVFRNESNSQSISLPGLDRVVQFEIKSAFAGFKPKGVYEVEPIPMKR